jgi:hypothetical protein
MSVSKMAGVTATKCSTCVVCQTSSSWLSFIQDICCKMGSRYSNAYWQRLFALGTTTDLVSCHWCKIQLHTISSNKTEVL